jgi:Predicted transcription factor, homolog of eukaryotic MBF1
MKIDKKQVGIRIHELRTQNNWSMKELANKIKASGKSTINEWEKGRTIPSKKFLEQLAKIFTVSTDYLNFGSFPQYVTKLLENAIDTEDERSWYLSKLFYLKNNAKYRPSTLLQGLEKLNKLEDVSDDNQKWALRELMELQPKLLSKLISSYIDELVQYLKSNNTNYDDNRILEYSNNFFKNKVFEQYSSFAGALKNVKLKLNNTYMTLAFKSDDEELNKIFRHGKKLDQKETLKQLEKSLTISPEQEDLLTEKYFTRLLVSYMAEFNDELNELYFKFLRIKKNNHQK